MSRWMKLAAVGTGAITLAALTAFSGAGASSAASAAHTSGSVRPIPASVGARLAAHFSSPQSISDCEQDFGIECYVPSELQKAYDLAPLFNRGLDGAGQTIVIVDSFGSPTIKHDLGVFDSTFGLPAPPSFKIIQPAGKVPAYPADPYGKADRAGWAFETTLDVEWSHVMAPGANILLVETPTSETEGVQGFPEIVSAENYVINHHLGQVISQSFAAAEQTFPSAQSILDLRSAYENAATQGVTVLAASGDEGSTGLLPDESCCYSQRVDAWPSTDPLVTSVGGTQLTLDSNGNRTAPDQVWNDTPLFGPGGGAGGGGLSTVFARPSFQQHEANVVGGARGTPDVSMSAAVNGAVNVFYSFKDWSQDPAVTGPEWQLVGGTSEASPLFSGIVAIADQAAGHPLGDLNPTLYLHPNDPSITGIVDVTHGNNSLLYCSANCGDNDEVDATVPGFNAVTGYDLASGLGTIDAATFVKYLAGGHLPSLQ